MDGRAVVCFVCQCMCAFRLEKHGLMDGWSSWGRGRGSKGVDNEDERQWVCFDLVMKDYRIAVESGWHLKLLFHLFFLSLLGLRLLFHTSRIKYNQSFHISFFPPLRCWKREKKNLGYCIGMSWVCDVILQGLDFISGMLYSIQILCLLLWEKCDFCS